MSNSQTLKDKLTKVTDINTANKIIGYVDDIVKNHDIDIEMFCSDLIETVEKTNISSLYNPLAYFKKVAESMAISNPEKYKKSFITLNAQPLRNALDINGFTGSEYHFLALIKIEEHIVKQSNIVAASNIMASLNKQLIRYCGENNLKTYKDFIETLLKSPVAKKCNIPVRELILDAKRECEEFDKALDELNNIAFEKTNIEDLEIEAFNYVNNRRL